MTGPADRSKLDRFIDLVGGPLAERLIYVHANQGDGYFQEFLNLFYDWSLVVMSALTL